MTGYMNEIVFSRMLGNDDIEQGQYWTDTTQCWVCQRWDKVRITVEPDDKGVFHQKISQVAKLTETIQNCVDYIMNKAKQEAEEQELIKQ